MPFGIIERKPFDLDVPGNSFALGVPQDAAQSSVMVATNNKYGFRGTDDSLSVSLIRSSFDPDPYPELGNHHRFSFAVIALGPAKNHELIESAYRFNHPLSVLSGSAHSGTRPLESGFLKLIEGTAAISSVKMPEDQDGKRWIVRVYETEGKPTTVKLQLFKQPAEAYFVDTNERRLPDGGEIEIGQGFVAFDVPPFHITAVCLRFE